QREIALEPAPLEPQRSVERLAEARARDADRDCTCARPPEQLASVVPPFAMTRIVGTCHRPSFLAATSEAAVASADRGRAGLPAGPGSTECPTGKSRDEPVEKRVVEERERDARDERGDHDRAPIR